MNARARNTRARVMAGVGLVVISSVFFATMDTTSQHVLRLGVPVLLGVWGRYFFQALATTAVALPMRGLPVLRTRRLAFHCLRGALLFIGTLLIFLSLKYVPVGELTAVTMLAPLLTTLLGPMLLKEQVTPVRWMLMAGGFTGTLVIIRPGSEAFSWVMLLPLCQVMFQSAFQIVTSKLARTEDPLTMHFYTGWVGAGLASLMLPYAWTGLPAAGTWALLVSIGVLGSIGHFLLILAFQRAPATTLMPCLYLQIAFAVVAGAIAFGHVPDAWAVAGMVLVAVCGMASGWLTLLEMRRTPAGAEIMRPSARAD